MVKVSVCIQTYNHKPFIAQALESVLMQETNFDYEIILGEDESNDGTREICIEYARRYPDRIRLFLRSRKDVIYINGRPTGRFNFVENLKAARAEYVALLDGDDYWTDPRKLQKQVEFLEAHPEYAMCCTNYSVVDAQGQMLTAEPWPGGYQQEHSHLEILRPNPPKTLATLSRRGATRDAEARAGHGRRLKLSTTVIRRSTLPDEYPPEFFKVLNGDRFLFALVSRHGNVAFFNVITACAHYHPGGIWSPLDLAQQCEARLETFTLMRNYFRDPAEQKALDIQIYGILVQLLALYLTQSEMRKLRPIVRRLNAYRFNLALSAWTYAFMRKLIQHLKSSPVDRNARPLQLLSHMRRRG